MRSAVSLAFLLASILLSPALHGANRAPLRKSALARRGLYHANVIGRFVDTQGRPVPAVRVQVDTGQPRTLPAMDTVSDRSGRFRLEDINTKAAPGLHWYPPDEWMSGAMAIAGESFTDIDVGDIRLTANTAVLVSIEMVGGSSPAEGKLGLSVVLEGGVPTVRIVGREVGGFYLLDQIPFRDGRWNISIWGAAVGESYSMPVHLEQGRRDQFFVIRLLRDTVKQSGESEYSYEGKMEVAQMLAPEQEGVRHFRVSGRLLGPNGEPIAGAIAGAPRFPGLDPGAPVWIMSDEQGRFDVQYSAEDCREPKFAYGHTETWSVETDGSETSCEHRWATARDVIIPAATRLMLNPHGVDRARVRPYWWHRSFGWRRFDNLEPWVPTHWATNRYLIALKADGYVPVVKELELDAEETPETVEVLFPFSTSRYELVVTSGGKPVRGATVDLESILGLSSDNRLLLGTYQTDARGSLRLIGDPRPTIEAFVYAAGYEPARMIWRAGAATRVELAPRNARLSIASMRPGSVARTWRADRLGAARTLRALYGRASELLLEPGAYDIVVYAGNGQVQGYQRIELRSGEERRIDAHTDERPTLIVQYPEDGWTASVSESAPGGMAVAAAIYSVIGKQFSISDTAAVLERESPRQSVFRVSRSGTFHVQLRRAGAEHTWWREVELSPGSTATLAAPTGTATLRGSMRTYDGGIGFSHHGWAGPRMQLIAVDPQSWSVTVYLPKRDGKHTFSLRGLPAGAYHMYQHLISAPKTYKDSQGKEVQYLQPAHAWGGIPVMLSEDSATILRDFIEYPFRDCAVKVMYTDGSPVDGAILRVRDRMSEAWRQVAEGPTTLSNADHPIPYPPAIRLKEGKGIMPAIRAGRLELFLEFDDGGMIPISQDVDPIAGLTLRIPRTGCAR